MKTFERQVNITDKVEVIELNKVLAVKSEVKSILNSNTFFISKSDVPNWDKEVFSLYSTPKKYMYFTSEFWDLLEKFGFSNRKVWDSFPDCMIDPMAAVQLPDFNEDKIVWFDTSSHLMYNIDAINPISLPYFKDYIGGITNEDFNLKKAQEILSKNPNVIWMSPMDIPYYNAEPDRDKALEFTVRLPQETHDLLCNYYRDVVKAQFWTVRVKEAIVWRPWLENKHGYDLDILGLKECYIGKKD